MVERSRALSRASKSSLKICSYCGRENEDANVACSECGTELGPVEPSRPLSANVPGQRQPFFRWKLAAIALWVFGVIHGLFIVVNVWIGIQLSSGRLSYRVPDAGKLAHSYYRGAWENGVIAGMCLVGWYFIRRRDSTALLIGILAVGFGLCITVRRWIIWQFAGTNPLPWLEPLLIWPCLLYPIVYAYREMREQAATTREKRPRL
jgi:hypothetical protein